MPLPMEKSEIISIIDEHLSEKISAVEINQVREFDLRDRMVRVEEALKYQGEQIRMLISQMDKRFEQMDKRFETMQVSMDNRFEQVDKRFEQMDKRFEAMQGSMDNRFEQVDRRFEQLDKRFESLLDSMDKRFSEQHNDIAELGKRMDRFMLWSFGATFSAAGIIIAIMKFLI